MSSSVEFDEDKLSYGGTTRPDGSAGPASGGASMMQTGVSSSFRNESKMVQFLMRHGVKSPNTAQTILIVVVVINVIITYVVIKYFL